MEKNNGIKSVHGFHAEVFHLKGDKSIDLLYEVMLKYITYCNKIMFLNLLLE